MFPTMTNIGLDSTRPDNTPPLCHVGPDIDLVGPEATHSAENCIVRKYSVTHPSPSHHFTLYPSFLQQVPNIPLSTTHYPPTATAAAVELEKLPTPQSLFCVLSVLLWSLVQKLERVKRSVESKLEKRCVSLVMIDHAWVRILRLTFCSLSSIIVGTSLNL